MKSFSQKKETLAQSERATGFMSRLSADFTHINDYYQHQVDAASEEFGKTLQKKSLKGYVYSFLHIIFIYNYRKIVRDKSFTQYTITHKANVSEANAVNYSYSYNLKEIHGFINSLNNKYKEPFMMYLSGLKHHEIADRMSLPLNIVRQRISYTEEVLQEVLRG